MTKDDFERMSNKYYNKIQRWAVYKWGDLGEDAVQEAFLRAFENTKSFNDSFSFVTWIYSYVPIIVANWRRDDKLVFDYSVDIFNIPDVNVPEAYLSYVQLIELCNKLPEKQKQAIVDRLDGSDTDNRKNLWWAKQVIKKAMGENED